MTDFTFSRYWPQLRRVKKPAKSSHVWWMREKVSHVTQVTAEEWDFIHNLPDEPDENLIARYKELRDAHRISKPR